MVGLCGQENLEGKMFPYASTHNNGLERQDEKGNLLESDAENTTKNITLEKETECNGPGNSVRNCTSPAGL